MTPEEIDQLADRFFAAIMTGDVDAARSIYADDVAVWHNFDMVTQDRERNLRTLGWMHAKTRDLRYTDIDRVVVADGFVQQHVVRGTAPDGTELTIPAMLRVRCAGGRITRLDEYLDPAQAAALTR
jgi:ketosteroid isomerase-like protein